jgi:hypothetical protein
VTIAKAWVGVDVSKGSHWEIVLDTEGEILQVRRMRPDLGELEPGGELLTEL